MPLSDADAARLVSLQQAYDRLIKGEATASIMSGGRRVDYAKADEATIKGEIDRLTASAASRSGRTRGAVRFRVL